MIRNLMNKLLYIFLFLNLYAFGQEQTENRFSQAENQAEKQNVNNKSGISTTGTDSGGGNPGDPMPIDQYDVLLLVTGIGIIYLLSKKKQSKLPT